jgi:type II secretory pathway pseudopilin PulG
MGDQLMKKDVNQSGFSYPDVMVAITILLVGVLGLVGAITRGIALTTVSQEMLSAKQLAAATMEAVFTARELDTLELGWPSIGNVGSSTVPNGMFMVGDQPIYPTSGYDGIVGTADDYKGPDGVAGNGDDGVPLTGYTRRITITDVPDTTRPTAPISLRRIEVSINYWTSGRQRTETFTSFIANYRTEATLDN